MTSTQYPVHPDVTVHSGETIYRTDEWWKAAVTHSYGDSDPELAIYLWHRDDDWSRKNKYHVKTAEAWHADKDRIKQYLAKNGEPVDDQSAFSVSDYYNVNQGESVFETEDWWKAIVEIDQKGEFDTHEVIIYLWQRVDGDWRRRQKYAIKNLDDWNDERDAVDDLLDDDQSAAGTEASSREDIQAIAQSDAAKSDSDEDILADVEAEVKDLHLGSGVAKES
ncbi:hypothetical protein [Halobacterium hubeiense]|uniref:hypothetical protein n=1 Tax=Halobacterium hubeiense TaxID=1407499 RepID=UPI003C73F2BD